MVSLHRVRSWPQPPLNFSWLGGLVLGALLLTGCGPDQAQIVTDATSYEAQLAQHLADTGSVMYGTYWCPHCADQKAMFGEAADRVPYVECAADGDNPQPELCEQKGIQGYPTWEIDGQLSPGVKSLDDLADLSGFLPPQ
ncbi:MULTISPECIES: glutaredoxin family protein [Cyanophyceae]|uniref:Thioredoxin domain-containing protein n=1 Tax=Leptolyngbya subtilissima DQ-A4 TaxID=2933933 RepID=A0ABV0JYH5_9CYAN|nr:hypothetical protein [Nodosilinea sp. FACHB-141]MBD2112215.1 hypothetical protein [Nodosilinea sp. FACHB-141]